MNCAKCRHYEALEVIFSDDDESGNCKVHGEVTFWFLGCDDWEDKEDER